MISSHSSEKPTIRVLLNSSRGCIALGRIEALKQNPDCHFYVIGADASPTGYTLPLLDEQVRVPWAFEDGYAEALLRIAREKRVDVIVPASDHEVEVISKHRDEFSTHGVACVCSSYETTAQAINKARMLTHLREKGISVPNFFLPRSVSDLQNAVRELGYPDKPVVVKPAASGGGNRGVWLLKEDFSGDLWKTKGLPFISVDGLTRQIERLPSFPDIVLMSYLPGEEYSVDGIAENGTPVYIVPRVRVLPLAGYSQEGLIKENPEVEAYVGDICRAFGFDSNFNVQLKYSAEGVPLVYEINPRISATVVANAAAGVDLFLFGILKALGRPYPKGLASTPTRMVRFWKEFYSRA